MNLHPCARRTARPVLYLLTLLLSITLGGCGGDSGGNGTPLEISGVSMIPHSYRQDGKITGLDVDIATMATGNAGIDYNLTLMDGSFTEAYNKTKAGPNRALLGINYSEERKDDFKWVGPTSKSGFYIFAKKSTGLGSTIGLEACKKIESIAVVTGWLETTTLEKLGFENLLYYPSYEESYAAFDRGDVKAIASEMLQLGYAAKGTYVTSDVDFCMSYKTAFYYMAISKDVDDSVIAAIQSRLDILIKSGKTYEILKAYFPGAIPQLSPGILQLFMEVAPPFNFQTGPLLQYQATGSSVDIANAIQLRVGGYISSISSINWFDGYANVQELPNSALLTTARTAEREKLFQWVGPIATMTPRFYTLAARNITATTLDDAKLLMVSTPDQWYTYDYLVTNGFGRIAGNAYSALDSFRQLLDGTADAFLMNAEAIDWLCNDTGTPRDALFELPLVIPQQAGYIAFSLNTPKATVDKWQTALAAIKAEGAFDRILLGWGLGAK